MPASQTRQGEYRRTFCSFSTCRFILCPSPDLRTRVRAPFTRRNIFLSVLPDHIVYRYRMAVVYAAVNKFQSILSCVQTYGTQELYTIADRSWVRHYENCTSYFLMSLALWHTNRGRIFIWVSNNSDPLDRLYISPACKIDIRMGSFGLDLNAIVGAFFCEFTKWFNKFDEFVNCTDLWMAN